MFAQYITKDDFQFQMLTTVTSSTSQINILGSKWSRHLAEQADVDPSLAAVADSLVFGQAQARARAQAQTWTWAERGPSEPIRPKAAQQHAPRHPKC